MWMEFGVALQPATAFTKRREEIRILSQEFWNSELYLDIGVDFFRA
jgi:hypothetical protein